MEQINARLARLGLPPVSAAVDVEGKTIVVRGVRLTWNDLIEAKHPSYNGIVDSSKPKKFTARLQVEKENKQAASDLLGGYLALCKHLGKNPQALTDQTSPIKDGDKVEDKMGLPKAPGAYMFSCGTQFRPNMVVRDAAGVAMLLADREGVRHGRDAQLNKAFYSGVYVDIVLQAYTAASMDSIGFNPVMVVSLQRGEALSQGAPAIDDLAARLNLGDIDLGETITQFVDNSLDGLVPPPVGDDEW